MFAKSLFYRVLIILSFSGMTGVIAQNNTPTVRKTILPPSVRAQASPAATGNSTQLLKSNYRVVIEATKGEDQSMGKLSLLTCSANVNVDGPLDSELTPSSMSLVGTLEEHGDVLVFAYKLGLTTPVASSIQRSSGDKPVVSNIQYRSWSGSGTLRMKVGQPYVVLVSGGARYSITITPESSD